MSMRRLASRPQFHIVTLARSGIATSFADEFANSSQRGISACLPEQRLPGPCCATIQLFRRRRRRQAGDRDGRTWRCETRRKTWRQTCRRMTMSGPRRDDTRRCDSSRRFSASRTPAEGKGSSTWRSNLRQKCLPQQARPVRRPRRPHSAARPNEAESPRTARTPRRNGRRHEISTILPY